jgi:glycerophosphoryl diester phosphodiesterase
MTPLNIAHRGGAGLWPENTLFAFGNAVARGFDGAELDVQLTRDGELVVVHDFLLKPELCRTPDGDWLAAPGAFIKDLTLSELRVFDIGRPKPGNDYARAHSDLTPRDGERIPLLSDVIEIAKARKDFRLFVEIKTNFRDRSQSAAPEAVAEAAIATLKQANFLSRAILCGFDWVALRHALKIEPGIACWFTSPPPHERKEDVATLLNTIHTAGGQGWSPSRFDAREETISQAHDLGLKVGVWTVNAPDDMRALGAAHADALITDRPDLLAMI